MAIVFAVISPHPPILLPSVGSSEDRAKVKKTIEALEFLSKKLIEVQPQSIIISAPHPDWGFNVPLHFLAPDFKGKIEKILIETESPQFYFNKGKKFSGGQTSAKSNKWGVIASGDLSHCLKQDGPYGFHPDGPKFDKDLIEALKNKDIERILKLDEMYPEDSECGLRSFCFLLGLIEASGLNYQPEILSYEGPFGVGYLVVNFKI